MLVEEQHDQMTDVDSEAELTQLEEEKYRLTPKQEQKLA